MADTDPLEPPLQPARQPWRKDRVFAVVAIVAIVIVVAVVIVSMTGGTPTPSITTGAAPATIPPTAPPTIAPSAPPDGPKGRPDEPDPFDEYPATIRKLYQWGLPVYCGGGNLPLVALTFDDGPGSLTQETVRLLRERGAGATFFLAGQFMKDAGAIDTAADEATTFDIGGHGHHHFGLAGASKKVLKAEVTKPQRLIEKAIREPVIYFRPPWGSRDKALERRLQQDQMIMVIWSLDSTDSAPGRNTEDIVKTIDRYVGPGDIVLLHENRGTTAAALPEILDILEEKRLEPVTLTELLTQDPPSKQQLRRAECDPPR